MDAATKQPKTPIKSQTQIRKSLGFWQVLQTYAGISGMKFPIPAWFLRFPKPLQLFIKAMFTIFELSLIFMAVSTIKGIIDEEGLSKRIECIGSLILLISAFCKFTLLNKQRNDFEKSITDIHAVANQLLFNPLGDRTYLQLHQDKTNHIHVYYKLRYSSTVILCIALISTVLIHRIFWPSDDQHLTMAGWFPIDHSILWQFLFASIVQFEYYMLISLRDFYCDAAIHFPLSTINVQLMYLEKLLEKIVCKDDNRKHIKWWITQHQDLLKSMDQFMTLAGSQLSILNSVSALQLFLYLFRITEENEIMITKHAALATVCGFMLVHVYVISRIGDDIETNSTRISSALNNKEFWDLFREQKVLLYHVSIRCTRPYVIRYSKIGKLRVETFVTIVTKMIGFFNTIYQVRNS